MQTLKGKPITHDAVGNITTLDDSTGKFTYNLNGSLLSDGKRDYTYNALGLRVEAFWK